MKKTLRIVLAFVMVLCMAIPAGITAFAEGESTAYIMFSDSSWTYQYWCEDVDTGVVATNATVTGEGEYTVALDFTGTADGAASGTAFAAVGIKDGETNFPGYCIEITSMKINGEEVEYGKGYTSSDDQIETRMNVYNEWVAELPEDARSFDGDISDASPIIVDKALFDSVETFEITFNFIEGNGETAGSAIGEDYVISESEETYDMFIALGGDKDADNDWAWGCYGGFVDGATAVNNSVKSGDTVTISLEFSAPVLKTWFVAPCLVGELANVVEIDADIACAIDGEPVDIDFAAGDLWWFEGTGDYDVDHCIRLAGGYNEWGAQYITVPAGISKIEYTITLNSIKTAVPPEYDPAEDLAKDYNAYIQFQTDVYTFRNNWDDASYGLGTENFDVITAWAADGAEIRYAADYTDAVIDGNGTYTVKVEFVDDNNGLNGSSFYNMLEVSTDIPSALVENGYITIENVTTSFDDGAGKSFGFIDATGDYVVIMVLNTYNSSVGTDAIAYSIPEKSIAITFDVAGFDHDGTAAPVEEAADDAAAEETKSGFAFDAVTIGIIAAAVVVVAAAVVLALTLGKKKPAAKEEAAAEETAAEDETVKE